MKKVCLVYPQSMQLPAYFKYATNIATDAEQVLPPLGILYLIGASKYPIDFIDNRVSRHDPETLFHKLKKYDIVGFGGTIFEIKEARKVSSMLMKEGVVTIYGGANATANWNIYINQFNIIVRGEAEEIIDKIIEQTDNLTSIGFNRMGNSYVNPRTFRISDLDKLPFPARNKIDLSDYKRCEPAYFGNLQPIDTVVSSRGCPFDCYFCSSKHIWSRRYSYRSMDNVISEIKFLQSNYDTKGVYFREDNFTLVKKRVLEFCRKIKKLDIGWLCESRVDALDEESIKLMVDSGCKGVWFGIESMDDTTLKRIGKGVSSAQIKETIDLCYKHGLTTGGGFMLGFPFDDKQSMVKNYEESKKIHLTYRFYNRVWAVPISRMYFEILNGNLDYYSFENIILPSTQFLSADQVNKIYFRLVSRKEISDQLFIRIIGEKNVSLLKNKLPLFYGMLRKCKSVIFN